MSLPSKSALIQLSLLILGGFLGFCIRGWDDRSTEGGRSLQLVQIQVKASDGNKSQQWIKGYRAFFTQMKEVAGNNLWGVVVLCPIAPNTVAASTQPIPPDGNLIFNDGSSSWPIVVSTFSATDTTQAPIVVPIDSMSDSSWSARDMSKMSLSFEK